MNLGLISFRRRHLEDLGTIALHIQSGAEAFGLAPIKDDHAYRVILPALVPELMQFGSHRLVHGIVGSRSVEGEITDAAFGAITQCFHQISSGFAVRFSGCDGSDGIVRGFPGEGEDLESKSQPVMPPTAAPPA